MLINYKAIKKSQSAKLMLLIYPRLYVRQLLGKFSRAFNMDVK
jgi:hypothetical protein